MSGTREVWRMQIALSAPPAAPRWPDGVSVRTYDAGDAESVHSLLELAFAGGGESVLPFEEWLPWMTGDLSFDPDVWFLAEAGPVLAGVALCWDDGFVKDLAVHPRWRRRGMAEALLREVFCAFHRRGVGSIELKVDSENPTGAVRLYQRVGMRIASRLAVPDP